MTKQDMIDAGLNLDVEFSETTIEWAAAMDEFEPIDVVDEDWLSGVSCNSDSPEECEACQ